MSVFERYINEQDYPDLNSDQAVEHLSGAVRINTTSYMDASLIDYSQLDRLHQKLKEWYPAVLKYGDFKKIGHSILIRIEGSDSSLKPALFMAHQDVVPVVKGTENDWIHGPFSGDVADGYIWGRGTLDIKNMLIGELESAEYLLEHGKQFRRTVYLAFGQDEEVQGTGARAIAAYLKENDIELEFLLDEGGSLSNGDVYGTDIGIMNIGIYEKGYADLKITSESYGGHSSNPFDGTSLGHLAKAIASIVDHPFENVLPECAKETLRTLQPYMKQEPLRTWASDIGRYEKEIIGYYLSRRELNNQIHTTIAPTMITEGSQAGNVMPQRMEAVINFRLSPQDTDASVLEHCRKYAGGLKCEYIVANEASRQSRFDTEGFEALRSVLTHYFSDVAVVPSVNTGATDARSYEGVCNCCMRFGPFMEENDIKAKGVHGTNERISIRAYLQGIRVLIRFMEQTC